DTQAGRLDRSVRNLRLRRLRAVHQLVPGRDRHHPGGRGASRSATRRRREQPMKETFLAQLLSAHPFTRELADEDREALAAISAQRSYTTDELLIREGAPASAFFLIVSGRAVIEVVGPGGAVQRLQTIEAGSAVGWS